MSRTLFPATSRKPGVASFLMEVILLTTLFSVLFAIFFLLLFIRVRQKSDSCAHQDSLLPFRGDEKSSLKPSLEETTPTDPIHSVRDDQ